MVEKLDGDLAAEMDHEFIGLEVQAEIPNRLEFSTTMPDAPVQKEELLLGSSQRYYPECKD